jgi:hypothetical protein
MSITTKELFIRWTGIRPLLLCNGELANPLNPNVMRMKPFATKRNKTEQEMRELAKMHWMGGLYYDPEIGPFLPVPNIQRSLQQGAAKNKKERIFKSSLLVEGMVGKNRDKAAAKIIYDGPSDPEKLYGRGYGSSQFVHQCPGRLNGKTTVLVTRPIFPVWIVEFIAIFEEDSISVIDVATASDLAGRLVGVGTWRPLHGQFKSEIIK